MTEKKQSDSESATDPTDVREQMRQALERKKAAQHGGTAHADGSSKASSATSSHKVQREFRRKSGG